MGSPWHRNGFSIYTCGQLKSCSLVGGPLHFDKQSIARGNRDQLVASKTPTSCLKQTESANRKSVTECVLTEDLHVMC